MSAMAESNGAVMHCSTADVVRVGRGCRVDGCDCTCTQYRNIIFYGVVVSGTHNFVRMEFMTCPQYVSPELQVEVELICPQPLLLDFFQKVIVRIYKLIKGIDIDTSIRRSETTAISSAT